jgi:hypothetical protein
VEGIRAVFRGSPGDPAVAVAIALFAILAAIGMWGAGRVFGRLVA